MQYTCLCSSGIDGNKTLTRRQKLAAGRTPRNKTEHGGEEEEVEKVRVQNIGNPLPAVFGSGQAISRTSKSNDHSASTVVTVTTVVSNVTGTRN